MNSTLLLLCLVWPPPVALEPMPLWYGQFPDSETAYAMSWELYYAYRGNVDRKDWHDASWVWWYVGEVQDQRHEAWYRLRRRRSLLQLIGDVNFRRGILPEISR